MSAKSRFVPTMKAIVALDCPQVRSKMSKRRKAKTKRVKAARAIMFKRRK